MMEVILLYKPNTVVVAVILHVQSQQVRSEQTNGPQFDQTWIQCSDFWEIECPIQITSSLEYRLL